MPRDIAPRGRYRSMTDEQLREDLKDKLPVREIAEKHGITPQAVYQRIDKLQDETLAAAVAPEESRRYVSRQIDAYGAVLRLIERCERFHQAADAYLRDPEHPSEYFLGARAEDVECLFFRLDDDGEPIGRKPEKATLSTLLDEIAEFGQHKLVSTTVKHADPRSLFIQASAEARALVNQAQELSERILAVEELQKWQSIVIEAMGRVSPELRVEVEAEIRRSLRHYHALCGAGANEPESDAPQPGS